MKPQAPFFFEMRGKILEIFESRMAPDDGALINQLLPDGR